MASDSILTQFKFTPDQKKAATHRSHAIAVTAGAGSGKTRVLVGRYLHLLEQGHPLRSLVAITFTDKAAREMRTRIRTAIQQRLNEFPTSNIQRPTSNLQSQTSNLWQQAFAELDAARIGTIHSQCAEILRAHPVEAALDPNFVVLEEGQSAAWQAQAIDAALVWAATRLDTAPLITLFRESGLHAILSTLIEKRLDVAAAWPAVAQSETILADWLDERLNAPLWHEALSTLAGVRSRTAGDKLEIARRAVLERWQAVSAARAVADWDTLFNGFTQLRSAISTQGQKANWAENDLVATREAMKALRDHYDAELAALLGQEGTLSWSLDRQIAAALPALQLLHTHALQEYQRLKDAGQALDFDDLEGRAAQLLVQQPAVRERWQQDVEAVLVDEFQDTNARQRDIVYALTGFHTPHESSLRGAVPSDEAIALPDKEIASQKTLATPAPTGRLGVTTQRGKLFIVGDAKQSIYKFRGADVTVFRQVQSDVQSVHGLAVDLDLTFRAHQPLVEIINTLLAPILGSADDPTRPYAVPFADLHAQRKQPERTARRAPYVEFHIGVGENAAIGRTAAAAALAARLHALHRDEDFAWSDIALLFRASTAFDVYEDALERASIPFITIAGRGFYDRPEIRDVLNALAAIHDPTDDLALAGLLRSPAIGLSDADLFHLRFANDSDQPRSLWETIKTSKVFEDPGGLIAELHDLSGRVSVAEVLKHFLDLTHYRALLSAVPQGHRLRRNIDKLLADAHASRLISLSEFLEYVQTLEDTGVREGEAPVDPSTGSGGGAVQLMTVHKAKGLEFPVVVMADAAHDLPNRSSAVLLDDQLGLQIDLTDADGAHPVIYRLARLSEQAKDDAEDKRLLYVAATRAKEKLIVSGHAKLTAKGNLALRGWLSRLGKVIGLEVVTIDDDLAAPRALELDQPIGCVLHPAIEPETLPTSSTLEQPIINIPMPALVQPLPKTSIDQQHVHRTVDAAQVSTISHQPSRVWRVVPQVKRPIGPAWVIGHLTHEALRRWRFPDAEDFDVFLLPFALEAGLTDHVEIQATINEVRRLLSRFQTHPLCAEIAQAERQHEVPYARPGDTGVIDLLYRRSGEVWTIVDFKTDEVRSIEEMRATIEREGYTEQVRRYVDAIEAQVRQRPRARLIFLRVKNEVQVVDV
jgi:ATP-dependent helicase/nuclease subunit A